MTDDSEDDELDLSWMNESEKMIKIAENYKPENMKSIKIKHIYINENSYIEKIKTDIYELESINITKEQIIELSHKNKINTANTNYILEDILVYNIVLEPENIQEYVKNNNSVDLFKTFFTPLHIENAHGNVILSLIKSPSIGDLKEQKCKKHTILDDIHILPSIFIFHSLNTIYFIYQEKKTENIEETKIKPILKTDIIKKKHTKKVHIHIKQTRNTKKSFE
jgi:hypothetical protein